MLCSRRVQKSVHDLTPVLDICLGAFSPVTYITKLRCIDVMNTQAVEYYVNETKTLKLIYHRLFHEIKWPIKSWKLPESALSMCWLCVGRYTEQVMLLLVLLYFKLHLSYVLNTIAFYLFFTWISLFFVFKNWIVYLPQLVFTVLYIILYNNIRLGLPVLRVHGKPWSIPAKWSWIRIWAFSVT